MMIRAGSDFFADLPSATYNAWKDTHSLRAIYKGAPLFLEGSPVEGIYLILQGRFKLFTSHANGRRHITGIAVPGDLVCLPSVIRGGEYDCSCQALEDGRLGFVSRDAFFNLLRNQPEMTIKMVGSLAADIHGLRKNLSNMACLPGQQRLAVVLLRLGQDFGKPTSKGIEIEITLSRKEIAEVACMASETTIRQLSAFQKQGLIRSIRRKLIITDGAGLTRLAKGNYATNSFPQKTP